MANVFTDSFNELSAWIRDEVEFPGALGRGDTGQGVRRIQEWLTLQEHGVVVDEDFGPATERAVAGFQEASGLDGTGKVEEDTWSELTHPMWTVLTQRLDSSMPFGEAMLTYAQEHLESGPHEVGGANCGPWVRLYMAGQQGSDYPWCAGFASFLIRQAADSLNSESPINGSGSCDTLAAQASSAGLFLPEAEVTPQLVTPGSLFLARRVAGDWTHTGLVVQADAETFTTIEGNTNDAGDREGYEVCARTRGYSRKDFALI